MIYPKRIYFKPKRNKGIISILNPIILYDPFFIIYYNCLKEPPIGLYQVQSCGSKKISFILYSEYSVEDFFVKSVEKVTCSKEGCEDAINYKLSVTYYFSHKMGIDFSFGFGAAALPYTPRAICVHDTFLTECICCDDTYNTDTENAPIRTISSIEGNTYLNLINPIVIYSITLYSLLNIELLHSRIIIGVFSIIFISILILSLIRHIYFRSIPDKSLQEEIEILDEADSY